MRAALWLMPEADAQLRLDAAIAAYARTHGRSAFAAHLTLVSGADPARLDEAAAQLVAARHRPLLLARAGVLRTEIFTRSYALCFAPSDALLALREDASLVGAMDDAPFIPHLSLTYGAPPDLAALDAISAAFAGPIRFDALVLNAYPGPLTDQADVARLASSGRFVLAG